MKLMMPEGTQQASPPPAAPANPQADAVARAAEIAAIKERGRQNKAERDALNKQRAENLAEQKKIDAAKGELTEARRIREMHATATTEPTKFLETIFGANWQDTLAKFQVGDKTPLEMAQLRAKLSTLEAKANEKPAEPDPAAEQAKLDAAQRQQMEQQFASYRADTEKRFAAGGEYEADFPALTKAGAGGLVADEMRRAHERGELDGLDAAGIIVKEREFATIKEGDLDKLTEGMLALPKWSARVKPPPAVKKAEPPLPFKVAPRAVSQQMAAGTTPPAKRMTREERKAALVGLPAEEWSKRVEGARSIRIASDE